mmetsp:Transcript_90136/g.162569  ORF Transcript_90136/g.162569 Transcript_90136/m.162569 type:complete len:250 (-) Transcript_90136:167-916(-)
MLQDVRYWKAGHREWHHQRPIECLELVEPQLWLRWEHANDRVHGRQVWVHLIVCVNVVPDMVISPPCLRHVAPRVVNHLVNGRRQPIKQWDTIEFLALVVPSVENVQEIGLKDKCSGDACSHARGSKVPGEGEWKQGRNQQAPCYEDVALLRVLGLYFLHHGMAFVIEWAALRHFHTHALCLSCDDAIQVIAHVVGQEHETRAFGSFGCLEMLLTTWVAAEHPFRQAEIHYWTASGTCSLGRDSNSSID